MDPAAQDSAGVKIFPPGVYAAGLIAGIALGRLLPTPNLCSLPVQIIGWILVALWPITALPALRMMRKAGTTIRPDKPVSALLTTGPFGLSRNPLYVALIFLYSGLAILLNAFWSFVLLPVVIATIAHWVIAPEEAYLERAFGDEYLGYKERVRRWL
jgi:protein-S-isoprenylcysteine O-methyltransferase Ste14